jgi:hypothetical protein
MSVGQVKGMLQGLQVSEDQIGVVDQARAGHPKAEGYKAIAPEENGAIPMKLAENPEKKPLRVTECEGLVRPEPPAVMKKPSFWQKLLHKITFWTKNTYVNRYKEYQRTLPDRMEAYKSSLQEYNNNLEALEQGENPSGLQEAYERAVQQAEEKFGPSKETSTVQKEAGSTGVKPASKEVTEQLENSLLNTLFEGVGLGNTSKEEQEKMREEIRGHIRATEGYQKMILSGDDNITAILNDPVKRHCVYTDIFNSAAEKMEQNVKPPINDELQRNNEKEMKQENIMLQIQ